MASWISRRFSKWHPGLRDDPSLTDMYGRDDCGRSRVFQKPPDPAVNACKRPKTEELKTRTDLPVTHAERVGCGQRPSAVGGLAVSGLSWLTHVDVR